MAGRRVCKFRLFGREDDVLSLATLTKVLSRIKSHPLNKGHSARAVGRFAYWQIRGRLIRRPITVDWIGKAKLIASIGDTGVTGNIYSGLLEFPEMSFLLHSFRPSDVFVDVGANAGCYTVLASKVVGGRTIAIEPVPETFSRLIANIEVNNLGQIVQPHNLGISDAIGKLHFSNSHDSMNHVIRPNESSENSIEVEVSTIDDLISEDVFIMKVDVEGFELPVLRGAERHLSGSRPAALIIELNNSGEQYGVRDADVVDLMHNYGFTPFDYEPFSRKLTPLQGKNRHSGNTIFIRGRDEIEQRIRESKAYNVNGTLL